jgi:hypothetical protein
MDNSWHFHGFERPASANRRAANPNVEAAARTPRIAAALAAADRMDHAILTRNAKEFSAVFADDAVPFSPSPMT